MAVSLCNRTEGCKAVRLAVDTGRRGNVRLYRRFPGSPFSRQSISTVGRVAVCKAEKGDDLRYSHPTCAVFCDRRCKMIARRQQIPHRFGLSIDEDEAAA